MINMYVPEGSIRKEGPSAGTAILTAIVSSFTKTKASSDIGKLVALAWFPSGECRTLICSDDGCSIARGSSFADWRFERKNPHGIEHASR